MLSLTTERVIIAVALRMHSFISFFKFFAKPLGMWGLSSPISDQTCATCNEGQIPNHWTSRGIPVP